MPACLSGKRLETLRAESKGGRAETAPELSTVESEVTWADWQEEDKRVRFAGKVQFRGIPHENRGRSCNGSTVGKARAKRQPSESNGKAMNLRWGDAGEGAQQQEGPSIRGGDPEIIATCSKPEEADSRLGSGSYGRVASAIRPSWADMADKED